MRGARSVRFLLITSVALACSSVASASSSAGGTFGEAPARVAEAAAAPAGFRDDTVVSLLDPTSMAFTPDGRMLVTQDRGQLRVVRDGVLKPQPALSLASKACTDGERGLTGLTVDPNFATNHYIYLFWTRNAHNFCGEATANTPENRVTRFVLGDNDIVDPSQGKVLIDHLPSPTAAHNGSDLQFGGDGFLYVSVGDGSCTIGAPTQCAGQNTNSRRLDIPNGKILRVTRGGAVPASNPYVRVAHARRCTAPAGVTAGTGPCTETYASGFRNPFRFAPLPGGNSFYVNDVGEANWEEIDLLEKGKDYGWNGREGHCATGSATDCGPTSFQNPIFDYSHDDGCSSITGGAFVPGGLWPAPLSGSYLFADYVCDQIFRLAPQAGGGFTREPFLTLAGRPVHLEFGPYGATQALYYLEYDTDTVHRVSYSGASNNAPTASFVQRPNGLAVTLDGTASRDPDVGDALASYQWDFGDGAASTTTAAAVTHTYPSAGTYIATLRVVDLAGAVSAPTTLNVLAGEHAPSISITAPPTSARFSVGQTLTVSATASDTEDGPLPASSITWTVELFHNDHTHPYRGPQPGSSVTMPYPAPEDLLATANSYLIATVVATDSRGLSSTVVRRLLPKKVTLTFVTSPSAGTVIANGVTLTSPSNVVSWQGYTLHAEAPDQPFGGLPYVFDNWSDAGARIHDIVTPAAPKTYTAKFRAQ